MTLSRLAQALMITSALAVMTAGCQNSPFATTTEISGIEVGTTYRVTVPGGFPGGEEALQKLCNDTFDKLEMKLSGFNEASEISACNGYKDRKAHDVSLFLGALIEECRRQGARVDNTMDISVGPLVSLWRKASKSDTQAAPSDADIRKALKLVGPRNYSIQKVVLDKKLKTPLLPRVPASGDAQAEKEYTMALSDLLAQSLRDDGSQTPPVRYKLAKRNPGVQLDLATVGEGLAIDMVVNELERLGIENYLVSIAGASRTKGVNPQGGQWQVGIDDPTKKEDQTFVPVCPLGRAMSTAGSYHSFYIDAETGKFYSNIYDPKTGRPVSHRTVSVTVIGDTALTTDALDTGLMVLGGDRALEFAERENVPVYIIALDGDGKPYARYSKSFLPYLDCK